MTDRGEYQRPSFLDQLRDILNPNARAARSRKGQEVEERVGRGMEWGGHGIQGRREEQQDIWRVSKIDMGSVYDYAAIFDGHGGSGVAEEAGKRLHVDVARHLRDGKIPSEALERAFRYFGWLMRERREGSTAMVALVSNNKLYLAHVGDSLAVLLRGGVAYPLNELHNPENERERQRVFQGGGVVKKVGNTLRLMAKGLAVSRAFGDSEVRGVSYQPDIYECDLYPGDVLIMMCDGVWKEFDPQGLVVGARMAPRELSTRLVESAFNRGSLDNLTAIAGKVG